jgi:hypothetical protein
MRRAVYVLFCATLLAALATYAWRGWYARYVTDDWCTAAILRERGFFGAMQHHREMWSGRFSYFPVKATLEAIGPVTTRFTPTIVMLLLGLAAAYAIRRLLPADGLLTSVAAMAVVFALIGASPSISNVAGAWYWETGSITYVLPLILFTFWLGLPASRMSIRNVAVVSALLMFVAGGMSETTLAAQGAMTGALLVFGWFRRSPREIAIGASGLVATLAALAIMGTAGGNTVRAMQHTDPLPFGAALLRTFDYAYRFVGWHLLPSGAALLPLLFIALLLGAQSRVSPRVCGMIAIAAIAAYIVSFLPSAWLLPWTAPERALDVPNYFVALALVTGAVAVGSRMKVPALALLVFAVIPLLAIRENLQVIPDARRFARQSDQMDAFLRGQSGRAAVLPNGSWALNPLILGPEPDFWVNRCVSSYYGLESLRVTR